MNKFLSINCKHGTTKKNLKMQLGGFFIAEVLCILKYTVENAESKNAGLLEFEGGFIGWLKALSLSQIGDAFYGTVGKSVQNWCH